MKIAHVADTHLGMSSYARADLETGRNQRTVDAERALTDFVDQALAARVDVVLHAGDVFHHARPNYTSLAHFIRQWRRFDDAGIPSIIIGGNHDTPRLRTSGSVFHALDEALPGAIIIAGYEPDQVIIDKWQFACFPYGCVGREFETFWFDELPMIGVFHGDPHQLDGRVIEDAQYVAMGHIHVRQPVSPTAWYSGCTERTSWGDRAGVPGWLEVEVLDGRDPFITVHMTAHRPMVDLGRFERGDQSAADVHRALEENADLEAMARIEFSMMERTDFRELARFIQREHGHRYWDLRVVDRSDPMSSGDDPVLPMVGRIGNLPDLLEKFVEHKVQAGEYDVDFARRFQRRAGVALEVAARAAMESGE